MDTQLNNYSNFTQRLITAIIGISIILSCILYNEWTFFILFCTISILTQWEFYKLLGLDGHEPLARYGTFCGIMISLATFLIEKGILPFKYYFLLLPMLTITFFIKLYKKTDLKPFKNLAFTFLGIIYVAIPFALINELAITENGYNHQIVLGCLFLLWASDTGAYLAGRTFGKRKLFERISPKKTWEGFAGGAILALIVAFILTKNFQTLSEFQWYGIAVIIVVAGTYGDLVESLFKRSMAIKDSGSTIPGHGGFLDRFDGLLLSMPFIVTFLKMFT